MSDMQSAVAPKRLDNLDLLKTVGILMVLSLHVPLWKYDFIDTPSVSRGLQYAMRLLCEGVPLFLTVNGFLLFRKDRFELRPHLKKTLRLFVLTLVWGVILAVAGLCLDRRGDQLTLRVVLDIVFKTRVGAKYTGVLWYLQNLIAVYLVFPVLWKVFRDNPRLFEYLFLVVLVFTLGLRTLELFRDCVGVCMNADLLSGLIEYLRRFSPLADGWYLFYFMLGGMLVAHLDWVRRRRMLLGAAGIVSWSWAFTLGYALSQRMGAVYDPTFNYNSVFMLCTLTGMFALALPYKNGGGLPGRFIAGVGQNTFGIYLSHFLFIFAIDRWFTLDTGLSRALATAAVFAASYAFVLLARRIPVVKRLVTI